MHGRQRGDCGGKALVSSRPPISRWRRSMPAANRCPAAATEGESELRSRRSRRQVRHCTASQVHGSDLLIRPRQSCAEAPSSPAVELDSCESTVQLGHSPRLPEALPTPLASHSNAPWRRCQLELELESQPHAQPELGSPEMRFGMLTTDSSWVRRGDSEEGATAGGLFAHADQVLAPYGSLDTASGSSSDPVTLEFRPHYAKGLYLSGASAPHCTAQPMSSWSGSRLMHWLSFQVRCESCVVSTSVHGPAVPAVLASLARADSSEDV